MGNDCSCGLRNGILNIRRGVRSLISVFIKWVFARLIRAKLENMEKVMLPSEASLKKADIFVLHPEQEPKAKTTPKELTWILS